MLQNTTSLLSNDSILKKLQDSSFYNDTIPNPPYKLPMTSSEQPSFYPFSKLENLHPNPALSQSRDELYLTAKRVKGNERQYNMLKTGKENDYYQVLQEETSQGKTIPDYSFKAPELDFYRPITYPYTQLDFPMSQPPEQQYINQVLLQNLYNNALIEAEILRRYNGLQELAKLQNMENTLLPDNLTALFLLSLQEKQKQDFYNLQLLQEAQQRIDSSMRAAGQNQAGVQGLEALKNNGQKNPEVIVLSDDDEVSAKSVEINVPKNFPEKEGKEKGIITKQEYVVGEPEGQYVRYGERNISSTMESEDSDAASIKKKKNKTVKVNSAKILTESNILPKPRAANKWQLEKEYQEQLRVEAEKPYFIDVHIDPNNTNQKINKTAVGKAHQTKISPFKLNDRTRRSRIVKPVWRPDLMEEGKLEGDITRIEQTLGEKITNQEKAVKLLLSFGMNVETVIEEIENNIIFYRNHFKTNPRILRKRQTNL